MRLLSCVALLLSLLSNRVAVGEDSPRPLSEAAKNMSLPEGFQATLFAGEPDVVQPIAFTTDDRGRLWVVECLSYPDWIREGTGNDRVIVLEDADGDGRFDKRTVFWDKGNNLSGIEVGFGGVWLCASPNLLFVPDGNGDDVPDGEPQVVLDGWSLDARHNIYNGLTWGPDGWLYGLNGIVATSLVGKPGTPENQRVPLNCGVWRYHPTQQLFEAVAWGTTNPWGLDFDDYGEMFITNCVIKHLFHVVPGAHFVRMYGQDLNPHVYGLLESCADHIHWGGGDWQSSREGVGVHDKPGGGHAHAGAMVYLGDNWPAEYRNRLFTCNIHGNRVNQDVLNRHRSGYVASHAHDFLYANDTWFRGLELTYGPDGGVFVTDWCDTGECHDYDHIDREHGRIYKVTYGRPKYESVKLAEQTDAQLVELQLHRNDWHVRHARRLLQERAAAGKLGDDVEPALRKLLDETQETTCRLRALWALHVIEALEEPDLRKLLQDQDDIVRGWAVRLLGEGELPSGTAISQLSRLARSEESAWVRLKLASLLQRLHRRQRWPIADGLVRHAEDADDAYLPLMIWYGIEPYVFAEPHRAVALIGNSQIPLVREITARRLAAEPEQWPELIALLRDAEDDAVRRDVLHGMRTALEGRRDLETPAVWKEVSTRLLASKDGVVRAEAMQLAAIFGDQQAVRSLRQRIADREAPVEDRRMALRALVRAGDAELWPTLQELLAERAMRGSAIRGLAAYNAESTPQKILAQFKSFTTSEQRNAVATLTSRPAYALALLDAIERNDVPRSALSAFDVRQLVATENAAVTARLEKVWGAIGTASGDKMKRIAQYKTKLTSAVLSNANRVHGRGVFSKTCAACHQLFDDGGKLAPNLTGSQRTNLDYLLENLLDPNAIVGRDFQTTTIVTDQGRVITGLVKREDELTVTLQTPTDTVVIPNSEIEIRKQSRQSIMPEEILEKLSDEDVRDLFAYLMGSEQVPLSSE